jgi:hypothetical protein
MPTFTTNMRERMASYSGRVINWIFNRTATGQALSERQRNSAARQTLYAINEGLYDNQCYDDPQHWKTIREKWLKKCPPDDHVIGWFSPFKEIVEAYQNVLPGTFGNGLEIDDKADEQGRPVNRQIIEPITTIWRDSGLDSTKAEMLRYGANLGTFALRAVQLDSGAVVVQVHHPGRIFDAEIDGQGNCVAVVLKYFLPFNVSTDPMSPSYTQVEVVEVITKEEFSLTFNGEQQLADDVRPNKLGFCPYVIAPHKRTGTIFGDWSYKGSEAQIHAINYRIHKQNISIGRHQFPKWILASGGGPPAEVNIGGDNVIWLELRKDTPNPFAQPAVPQIDQEHALKFWIETRNMIRGRQPELTINDVQLFSNISGETIAQVLKPAEAAILGVRPNYDHALIRAMQMALTIGAKAGRWELGTTDLDEAYRTGLLNWRLKQRPALPMTPQMQVAMIDAQLAEQNAKLAMAAAAMKLGLPLDEVWKLAGYTTAQIAKMKEAKAKIDVVPTVDQ